jgi:hypothetical protein
MLAARPIFAAYLLLSALLAVAKDQPIVVNWPEAGDTVLRFTVSKISKLGSAAGQSSYALDMIAENLWSKKIPRASFNFYLFDKNKARVGEGYIDLSNVGSHETVKMQVMASTVGQPVAMTIVPNQLPAELQGNAPPKKVAITIYSVPTGAKVKVDGKESGVTPIALELTVGSHNLQFLKEGYNTGNYPLAISPSQIAGGSVTYELGASAHDTIEMRDGSVLSGDVQALTATSVEITIGGQIQTFNRNSVKRISLVERDAPSGN